MVKMDFGASVPEVKTLELLVKLYFIMVTIIRFLLAD